MRRAVFDPEDQRRRRRRARITQGDIAKRLSISSGALSQYESGKDPLPWGLAAEDYELALAAALLDKHRAPAEGAA